MDFSIRGGSHSSWHRARGRTSNSLPSSFQALESFHESEEPGLVPQASCVILPEKLQGELDLPRRGSAENLHESRRTNACPGFTSECAETSAGASARRGKVYVVEEVEELRPELQGLRLRELEILEQSKVQILGFRSPKRVAPQSPECVRRRKRESRQCERNFWQ